eukprot:9497300-Pyramimonas_sp.AAC.1
MRAAAHDNGTATLSDEDGHPLPHPKVARAGDPDADLRAHVDSTKSEMLAQLAKIQKKHVPLRPYHHVPHR